MALTSLQQLEILVVDDEPFAQKLVGRVLATLGINSVAFADHGEAAIETLETGTPIFDLVISDIEMPGMDGFELVRKIRFGVVPAYKNIPVLMLTGKNTNENARSGRIHKISGYVEKPANAQDLEREIRLILDAVNG